MVDSTKPDAILERRVSTTETMGSVLVLPTRMTETKWEPVCVAPCRVELDRYSSYRIRSENGITGVSDFTLPQGHDPLHLSVDAGNLRAHHAGVTLTSLGTAAVIVGAALLFSSTSFIHEDDARLAGFVTGGAGIAALGIGIPLAILTRTKITSDDGPNRSVGGLTLTQKGIVF